MISFQAINNTRIELARRAEGHPPDDSQISEMCRWLETNAGSAVEVRNSRLARALEAEDHKDTELVLEAEWVYRQLEQSAVTPLSSDALSRLFAIFDRWRKLQHAELI